MQVTVKVGGQRRGTAATEGEENPDWEETLEFAVGGDVVDREDEQVSTACQYPPSSQLCSVLQNKSFISTY